MSDGLSLPELSSSDAVWAAEILGRSRRIPFAIGSTAWTSQIVSPPAGVTGPVLRLLAGETSLWVVVSDWQALLSGSAIMQGVVLAELPGEIAVAVVEAAIEPLLDAASKTTGVAWSVLELQSAGTRPQTWAVGLRLNGADGAHLNGAVSIAAADRPVLQRLIEQVPAAAAPGAVLPAVALGVEIGMTSLPVADLRALRSRDVLLMDVTAFRPDGNGVIRTSRTTAWRVTAAGGQVTLVEPRTVVPSPPVAIDSPSVNVLFELGEVVLAVDQLGTLAAGRTFPIENGSAVRLKVDGQVIGRGELIEVGSKLGVKIAELGRSPR